MGKLLILLIFVSCSLFFVWQGIYSPKNPISQAEKVFLVEKGEGTKEISVNLEKENLIKYGFLFRTYALIAGKSGKLQAGEYLLSPAMNIPQITEKLSRGEVVKKELTVPEGFTLDQIEERLKISDLKDRKIKEYKEDYQFLKDAPSEATLEGYLFPDTYQLSYQAAADEIVRKMLNNFDKKLTPDLREEIKNQEKTIFEIITMASMIEKEVKTKEDKELASGVLWKRLENKIPLQVDATIIYITAKKTTKVSKEETQIDSPYNTYKYLGLPVGPICNPGIDCILAAVYPKSSKYWYYLSTPEGETIFSKTLEEHNIAKAKYLK